MTEPSKWALERASQFWYGRITAQPTVQGRIEELALALDAAQHEAIEKVAVHQENLPGNPALGAIHQRDTAAALAFAEDATLHLRKAVGR